MNVNDCFNEAWTILVNEVVKSGANEKLLCTLVLEDSAQYKGVAGYLDGYLAAKGFGFGHKTFDFIDGKIKENGL